MADTTITLSRDAYDALLQAAKRGVMASEVQGFLPHSISDQEMMGLAEVRNMLDARCLIPAIANLLYNDSLAIQREQRLFQEHQVTAFAIQDACARKIARMRKHREAA